MPRSAVILFLLVAAPGPLPAAQAPLESKLEEKVDVDFVILDVMALDGRGQPVAGLTLDEFQLVVANRAVEIDTLDFVCSEAEKLGTRKFVLALDYLHLSPLQRAEVIDHLRELVDEHGGDGVEFMVVALTGDLRIEQPLTADRAELMGNLARIRTDPTLANEGFHHPNEKSFVASFAGLFDVLEQEPGSKAVLFYSAIRDVPLEEQFTRIAAAAASSRSVVYAVDVRGLVADERELAVVEEKLDKFAPLRGRSSGPTAGTAFG